MAHVDFPEIKKRLTKAFRVLRKQGYAAKQNYWCCQSCGWAAIDADYSSKDAAKAVFYHKQDAADIISRGEVFLAWRGIGGEIVTILRNQGLDVEWDGEENTRILVKGLKK